MGRIQSPASVIHRIHPGDGTLQFQVMIYRLGLAASLLASFARQRRQVLAFWICIFLIMPEPAVASPTASYCENYARDRAKSLSKQTSRGGALGGAARGGLTGAVFGTALGNTGRGAAVGGALGAVRGGVRRDRDYSEIYRVEYDQCMRRN
jgi:hypothetical protein